MPDARFRPPDADPDFALTDGRAERPWLRRAAFLLVPVLACTWYGLEVWLRWVAYDNVLRALVLPGTTDVWHNVAVFVIGFGLLDIALALAAFRPIARVYGRWATLVACLVVLPYVVTRITHAASRSGPGFAVTGWLEFATAAFPLVLMTWARQRRLAKASREAPSS